MRQSILWALLAIIVLLSSCAEDSAYNLNADADTYSVPIEHTFHSHRTCGHKAHMDKLLSDPDFRKEYEARIAKHQEYVATKVTARSACANPVTIPVAFHFQGISNPNASCLQTLALEQLNVLNVDYQGTNGDISNWNNNASSFFPGVSNGEACLEFVFADTNHPSGYGLSNGDLAITVNTTTGDFDSNWSGYLNIYIRANTGVLGYSPLGGAGNGDGVVVDASAVGAGTNCNGAGATAPYNLGRTLTHEVGHYLLLDHIWGNGCGQDDGISDTPNQQSDYSGCPNLGASSCGSTDMHMNYMDYSDDACMYMFTAGQATVSENYVASSLTNITSNASNVISGSTGGGGGGSTCAAPTTTSANVLGATSATITWDGHPDATGYQLRYRVDGTSSWTSLNTTTAETTITGLAASTTYDYRVRTQCPSGWTSFTSIEEFTTTSSGGGGGGSVCTTPSFTSAVVLSSTSATITWEGHPDATNYQFRYREDGTTAWTSSFTTTPETTLTGLSANTTYDYRVRTRCPNGWTGFTTTEEFTTTGSGNGGGGGNTCAYPGFSTAEYLNPTKTKVSWESMPQASRYQIRYRKVGTSAWTSRGAVSPNRTLTALETGATYEYKIRSKCPSGWTGFSGLETFEQSNGSGGGGSTTDVHFELTLDDYGSETSWELVDANNNVVASGGPYSNGSSGQLIQETFNLGDGCYILYVDDSYGDGICCNYGNGSFQLLDDNNVQVGYSNGNFGFYDYIDFCITNNVVTFRGGDKDSKATMLQPKEKLDSF